MMIKNIALLFVLTFLTSSFLIGTLVVKAESRTIVVPDDYRTLTSGLENALDGDTVFVKSGVYYERIVIDVQVSLL